MRLLIIEDSDRLRETLTLGLRHAGYAVDTAADGPQGLYLAECHPYDVIVLDRMLPGLDGVELLQKLRAAGSDVHVLMLTAKDRVEDKVAGLRAGADDYLIKPFAFDELLARIEALVRRRHDRKSPFIQLGDLRLDTSAKAVCRQDARIDLAPREYAILEYLALRRGAVVSRSEIEAHIYDDRSTLMSNVVDTVIYALRKKIDAPGAESLIHTRRGHGYFIETEPA